MPLSLDEFWSLCERSSIFEPGELPVLRQRFADDATVHRGVGSRAAAEWLVKQHKLTVYQAKILLRGQHGPFQLGDYRLLQPRLVPGRVANRWNGVHVGTCHRVLLHLWPEEADLRWPLARERAEGARRIRHPNLNRVYTTVEVPARIVVVSEWPEGNSLQGVLRRSQRVPAAQACGWVQQVATGLAHLHALGFMHGGLCPSEVVAQPGGHVKLLHAPWVDAGQTPSDPSRFKSREACLYRAPEFLQPGTVDDPLTDVYALGCVLYQLITGQPPFASSSANQIMADHAARRIEPLENFAPVPAGLTELVSSMMAKRRELRIPDANDVVDRLSGFVPLGTRQTASRARATESYYLAHLQQTAASHLPPVAETDVDENRVVIAVEPKGTPVVPLAKRSKENRWRAWRWPLTAFGLLSFAAAMLFLLPRTARERHDGPAAQVAVTPAASRDDHQATGPLDSSSSRASRGQPPVLRRTVLVDDDGRTLWASPTAGPPIDLYYVPPDSQMFVHARPASLAAAPEGMAMLKALGPEFAELQTRFQEQWGLLLTDIQEVLVSFQPQDVGPPQIALRLRLAAELCQRTVAESPARRTTAAGQIVSRNGVVAFFPASLPEVMVVGQPEWIEGIAGTDPESFATGPLRRQLEALRLASDADRHFSVLVAPNFLAADGRMLWSAARERLREPVLELLGDATQAASLSLHTGEGTYLELRLVGSAEDPPLHVASDRLKRLRQLPEQVIRYLEQLSLERHWQPLAIRFPQMVDFLVQQIRAGADDSSAILSAVIPPGAAHNLILASELALANALPVRGAEPAGAATPGGIEAVLAEPIGLRVDQQSLDMVVQDLAEAVRQQTGNRTFSVRIVGSDLELDGITQNQQIRDLQLAPQPLRQVLTRLAMRGNPVEAADPRQADQRLVWVISPDRTGTILITTRAAAREKHYSLPEEFVAEATPLGLQ